MFAALTRWAESSAQVYGFLILALLHIALDRWWKGSAIANVVTYLFLIYVPIVFGIRVRVGYLRRKPHWTRESWLRFLRLTAWPIGALILLFVCLLAFDSSARVVFGAPQSVLRVFWILVFFTLMGMGVCGIPVAIDWLVKGEPSEQFTRTRWMQWRVRAN